MSLKFFHIGFIGFCTLFSLGFGAWCLLANGLPSMFSLMGWFERDWWNYFAGLLVSFPEEVQGRNYLTKTPD